MVDFKIKRYKRGGLVDNSGLAWLDGTKKDPERVLSPKQTKLFELMVQSLEKQSLSKTTSEHQNSSYTFGDINSTIVVEKAVSDADIERAAKLAKKEIVNIVSGKSSFPTSRGR